MVGTPSPQTISTKQLELATRAERYPHEALSTLAHFIDLDWLREAYRRTRKDGAPGVDGQVAAEYEAELEANLSSLLDRFKSGLYRAPPVKRIYIPKGEGKRLRPIGIPTLEDKVLQRAVVMILEPLYEQQFSDSSYGFRPGRSAHQALDALWQRIMPLSQCWLIELDIESFFDRVDRARLREMVARRVSDGVILRVIGKWLQAGVLEGTQLSYPEQGTPQGGVISPLLANIYLHEGAPGQTWCFQRVKFPPRQGVQPPHRESSLGSEEATNRTKRRQSDERAVTKVKQLNLVKYLSAGRQRLSGWQAPVGTPSMARWPETAAGSESTARSETEASRDLGDPLRSWFLFEENRVCRTIWLTPEEGRRCSAKSDSLVVLRARESRVHGEAAKQVRTGLRDTSPAPTEAGV